jgi:hypothetical protein
MVTCFPSHPRSVRCSVRRRGGLVPRAQQGTLEAAWLALASEVNDELRVTRTTKFQVLHPAVMSAAEENPMDGEEVNDNFCPLTAASAATELFLSEGSICSFGKSFVECLPCRS